jgi:hypothetical protein
MGSHRAPLGDAEIALRGLYSVPRPRGATYPRVVVLHGLEVLLHPCTGHSLSASRDVLRPGGVLTGAATLNYDGLNGCSRRAKQL